MKSIITFTFLLSTLVFGQDEIDPFGSLTEEELAELQTELQRPSYPIGFLEKELKKALDSEWTVRADKQSITLTSKFKLHGFGRVGTSVSENVDDHLMEYEIVLRFAPPMSEEDYNELAAKKTQLRSRAGRGFDSKRDYSNWRKKYDGIKVPSFRALDQMALWINGIRPEEIGNFVCYMETSDHPAALFRSMKQYQKCKAAEAVVRTYFIPYQGRNWEFELR